MKPAQARAAAAPLLAPAEAARILEDMLYERVIECVNLDRLFALEEELVQMVLEVSGGGADARQGAEQAIEVATAMIDRALAKLPDDPRRYATFGSGDGTGDDDCELCAAEAMAHAVSRPPKVATPAKPTARD